MSIESRSFRHRVMDVAAEIVDNVDSRDMMFVGWNSSQLLKHYEDIKNGPGDYTRFGMADSLTRRDGFDSSSNIGHPHFSGHQINEAVAYTYMGGDRPFDTWPDGPKRYLLDRALQTDIDAWQRDANDGNARERYIGPKDAELDRILTPNPIGEILYVPPLIRIQEKLREEK